MSSQPAVSNLSTVSSGVCVNSGDSFGRNMPPNSGFPFLNLLFISSAVGRWSYLLFLDGRWSMVGRNIKMAFSSL